MRAARFVLFASLGIVALLVIGVGVFVATFDANSLKPRIADAVRRATGRDLAIDGPVHLVPSLRPTVALDRVALANVAGGSRPAMATAKRIELQLALLPLLSRRVEIDRLVVTAPDILLETDKSGAPNWRFGPAVPAQPLPSAPAAPPEAHRPFDIFARAAEINDGVVTYRDDRTGAAYTLTVAQMQARMADAGGPVDVALSAAYAGTPFAATARVERAGAVTLHVGETNLGKLRPGLALTALDVAAPAADQPVRLSAAGRLGTAPLGLQATLASPAALAAQSGPLPVDVAISATGATATAKGTLTDPAHLSGLAAAVAAAVPDLAALSPLAGQVLPALRDVAFHGNVANASAQGFSLHGASLATAQGDLAGDATVRFGARPSVQATLVSRRIDLDALRAALRPAPAPAPQPAAPGAPAASPAPKSASGHVIPDTPLPLDALKAANADIRLSAASVVSGGEAWRDLSGHLVLADGALRLDPFAATLPEGKLAATLSADAKAERPPVALSLHAPGLALKPILTALGLPDDVAGSVELDADIRGAGRSPHEIAAGADGAIGAAMVDGKIDNRLIQQSLGEVARRAGLPDLLGRGGSSALRCFALRIDLHGGKGDLRTFLLDTALIEVEGGGGIDFGAETLNLQLRPLARMGGTGVMVPLDVTGGFRAPHVAIDARGAASEAAGLAAGAAPKSSPLAGIVIGALGGNQLIQGAGGADCGAALASARNGRPGRVPAPAPAAADGHAKPPNPGDLLRRFLR